MPVAKSNFAKPPTGAKSHVLPWLGAGPIWAQYHTFWHPAARDRPCSTIRPLAAAAAHRGFRLMSTSVKAQGRCRWTWELPVSSRKAWTSAWLRYPDYQRREARREREGPGRWPLPPCRAQLGLFQRARSTYPGVDEGTDTATSTMEFYNLHPKAALPKPRKIQMAEFSASASRGHRGARARQGEIGWRQER